MVDWDIWSFPAPEWGWEHCRDELEDYPDSSLLFCFSLLDQWQAQLHREEAGN